jgi:hypothetical protein
LILLLKSLEEISIQDKSRRSAADLLYIICWSNVWKKVISSWWTWVSGLSCIVQCDTQSFDATRGMSTTLTLILSWILPQILELWQLKKKLVDWFLYFQYESMTWSRDALTVTDMWADSRRDDCCWWYAPAQGRDGSTSRRLHRPPRSRLCSWVSTQQLLRRHYTPKYFFLVVKLSWKAVHVFLSLLVRRSIFFVICRHDL